MALMRAWRGGQPLRNALARGVSDLAGRFGMVAQTADTAAGRASVLIAGPLGLGYPRSCAWVWFCVVIGLASDIFSSGPGKDPTKDTPGKTPPKTPGEDTPEEGNCVRD